MRKPTKFVAIHNVYDLNGIWCPKGTFVKRVGNMYFEIKGKKIVEDGVVFEQAIVEQMYDAIHYSLFDPIYPSGSSTLKLSKLIPNPHQSYSDKLRIFLSKLLRKEK